MIWDPQKLGILDVETSKNYPSLVCQPIGDKETYMITSVYVPQQHVEKLKLINSFEGLRSHYPNIPQILAGDFSMIRSLSEKKGGIRQLGRDFEAFQDFLMNMGLVDTETTNGTFTWNNKRGGVSQVESKLDRFIISEDLILRRIAISVSILPFGGLDHQPVQLEASLWPHRGICLLDSKMLGSLTPISP